MADSIEFSCAVSFESDSKPPQTVRMTFLSEDFETAAKTAIFRAFKEKPIWKVRSISVLVEQTETVTAEIKRQKALRSSQD